MTTTKTDFGLSGCNTTDTREKLAITVLAGGPGGEREISLQSGEAVAGALRSLGHAVHCEDITPQNLTALARDVDCVFVALHGTFGEDGQVQRLLEGRGLRYTGSAPSTCMLAMNKAAAKGRLRDAGIPTPRWDVATAETMQDLMTRWRPPVVVKPVAEGSSLACHMVREASQFRPAIERVVAGYGEALIEEYISGLEITVGILGDRALDPIEIRTRREFYDYQAKYVDEDTEYLFDIDLAPNLLERLSALSLTAHRELGCRDFSRVDWRVDPDRGEAYVLEVNVIPGLTSHSLLPKAAARAGLSMPAMCQSIVDAAMSRDR